jgi:hypothetical protein
VILAGFKPVTKITYYYNAKGAQVAPFALHGGFTPKEHLFVRKTMATAYVFLKDRRYISCWLVVMKKLSKTKKPMLNLASAFLNIEGNSYCC